MRCVSLVCVAFLMAATSATAEGPGKATVDRDPEQIVCKTDEKAGTRFASRTCKTKAEWDRMAEEHKRAAADMVAGALPRACDRPDQPC